jgi:hypothetical protein
VWNPPAQTAAAFGWNSLRRENFCAAPGFFTPAKFDDSTIPDGEISANPFEPIPVLFVKVTFDNSENSLCAMQKEVYLGLAD